MKRLILAALAALPLTAGAIDPDASHNNPWQSPRFVAPKVVEVWTLMIVWRWPSTQIDYWPVFDSEYACRAVIAEMNLEASMAAASCVQ